MADKNIGAYALGSVIPGVTHMVAVQAAPSGTANEDPVLIPCEDAGGVGPSAYDIAVDNGFVGTEAQWLATLVGPQGAAGPVGPQGAQGAGLVPDEYGNLDEAKITAIETAAVDWVFVVNPLGDLRANQNLPAGIVGDMERHVIRYDSVSSAWKDFGQFTGLPGPYGPQGIQGIQGDPGADGASAYQAAVDNGFVGTVTQWLASLKGTDGAAASVSVGSVTTGAAGSAASVSNSGSPVNAVLNFVIPRGNEGPAGPQGDAGAGMVPDEYGIINEAKIATIEAGAVSYNFLVIAGGDQRSNTAVPAGIAGDMSGHLVHFEPGVGWDDIGPVVGVAGPAGPQGNAGSDGDPGPEGLSAYQVAVNNGFVGTEAAWLASLQGPQGVPGSDGTNGTTLPAFDIMIGHPAGIAIGGYPITLDAPRSMTITRIAHKSQAACNFSILRNGASVFTDNASGTKQVDIVAIVVTQGDELTLQLNSGATTFLGVSMSED